ncbi:MAG: hypothetical protein JSV62_01055 [Promethearchaeota archaeon]|nr:MAG: hypothetical protein JSV62_01055 [Candidatus Lokiarchaeota archaeon]
MQTKNQIILILIGIISFLIVLLTPYGIDIDIGPGPVRLLAILWEYFALTVIRWFTVLIYIPYYIFRFITLYYIMRYIMGTTSKKKVIIISIISELIPLLLSIIGLIFPDPTGEPYINTVIPIPILLLYNLILVFLFSTKKLTNN